MIPLLLLALACAAPQQGVAAGRPVAAGEILLPDTAVEVPLRPYFRELRIAEVVGGSDTLRFLLDSGGGHTLLTPGAARALGCEPFGRSIGHRMSGEQVAFQWCQDVALALGGVSMNHSLVAVFDLAAVLPPELPGLDGLLSLRSFEGRIVTIDLAGDRIILESATSAATRRSTMAPLLARVATGEDGSSLTLLLAAHAQPAPIWLLLDSGNLVGTILSPHALRQVWPEAPGAEDPPGAVLSVPLHLIGLSRRSESALVRDVIYDGVLGASFFMDHVLMFDLRGPQPWVDSQRRMPDG